MEEQTTRTKSIRKKCLDCSDGMADVKNCEFKNCELYPGRMGRRPKGFRPSKAIQSYCKGCSGDNAENRRECPSTQCPLWEWRLGRLEKKEEK